jgi:hypothetical protein
LFGFKLLMSPERKSNLKLGSGYMLKYATMSFKARENLGGKYLVDSIAPNLTKHFSKQPTNLFSSNYSKPQESINPKYYLIYRT